MEVNNLNLCIKTKLVTVGADAMINCKVCLVIIADTSICFLIPVSYFGANYLAYVNYTYAPSFFVVAMSFAVKYTTIINQSCFFCLVFKNGNFLFLF